MGGPSEGRTAGDGPEPRFARRDPARARNPAGAPVGPSRDPDLDPVIGGRAEVGLELERRRLREARLEWWQLHD